MATGIIVGYIMFGLFLLLLGWALKMWWRINKWIVLTVSVMILFMLFWDAMH